MVEQVKYRYLSKKKANRVINMIQCTDFTNEDKVFDLGMELSLVGRELLCKCITDKAEGDAYLNDNRYFSWFRQE